jgi:GNAT superfamily N-acetyltransferase
LPLVYDLNFMRLETDCDLSAVEIAEEAEEVMAAPALAHRELVIESPGIGERLAPGFQDLGWRVDRHVVMVRRRAADRDIDTSEVQAVDEPTMWPARERYLRTFDWFKSDEVAIQMHAAYRTWMRASDGVDLGILRGGLPVSFAMLWSHGPTAQIEDVATLEAHRNQGLSRAVVTRAVELATERGCDLVFLVADDADWPKELYEKLGFDPVTTLYQFLKTNS